MRTTQFPDKLHRPQETTTKNLNRRGRKTRTAVTAAEVDLCAYFVLSGNAKQASLQAGYSAWWGYALLKMPFGAHKPVHSEERHFALVEAFAFALPTKARS